MTVPATRPASARAPSLLLFGAASLLLHAGAAIGVRPHAEVFHPVVETLAGETLDVEPEPPSAEDSPPSMPVDDLPVAPATALGAAPALGPARAQAHPSEAASATANAAAPPPFPFGAAGVRYASDLATTFTRSFPQAASGDKVWTSAPFGPAGVATVSLVIDDSGRLLGTAVLGSPSPALRRGIERTLALIEPRVFTASAAITKLRVSARVSRDDVHDGLHGDVFALSGGSFAGEVGSAFFALPAGAGEGRRVDVEVRVLP